MAQDLVNDWRASFSLPLRAVFQQVGRAAKAVDDCVITSRRLKRMESILAKLRRSTMKHMKLSAIQDIGGCRAIFSDIDHLTSYVSENEQFMRRSDSYVRHDDYINLPKSDGYRGVHIVVRPQFRNPNYEHWNSHKIEIQLRTQLQHAWATAVETVDLFLGEKLKLGDGDPKWKRFFVLSSSVFALAEKAPIVPDSPSDRTELAAELSLLSMQLDAWNLMQGWATSLEGIKNTDFRPGQTIALVTVDPVKLHVQITTYPNEKLDAATAAYAEQEQRVREGNEIYTVLVALERMQNLGKAYPNLYADTRIFWNRIERFLAEVIGQVGSIP